MSAVALGAIFFAVLLVAAAVVVWRESRWRRSDPAAVYLMDEAVRFVHGELCPETADRLGADGVRVLLEVSMHHHQVVVGRDGPGPPVLGGPAAVAYVTEHAARSGRSVTTEEAAAVVEAETRYLASIGAVGEAVEEGEP